jgi:hypothetical protein
MVRLNAIKELCNRGHGRPPQQPIEGLTPQLPENPTEDEIVDHFVRSGLAPLFASALDQMKADIVTTPATRPEGQYRSRKRDVRGRDSNKNTKRSTAKWLIARDPKIQILALQFDRNPEWPPVTATAAGEEEQPDPGVAGAIETTCSARRARA